VPEGDVRWELFDASTTVTACPFKGEATYWSLVGVDPPKRDVVWTYRQPPGIGESAAHLTLATGPVTTTVWLLDEIDVTEWLLYANPAPWSGRHPGVLRRGRRHRVRSAPRRTTPRVVNPGSPSERERANPSWH